MGFNAALLVVFWRRFVSEERNEEALVAELYADMESRGPQWFTQAEDIEGKRSKPPLKRESKEQKDPRRVARE